MTRAVLHGYFRSSAAFRVRIALQLKGLDVEQVSVQLRAGEQHTPEFLKLNPAALIPVYVTEQGAALSESLAIIEYLDEVVPEPRLLPAAPLERARVRSLAYLIACDVHPIQNLRVLQRLRTQFGADDDAAIAWARHYIELGLGAFEVELARSPKTGRFCHGDTPTLADICLIPQIFNARRFKVDLTPFPTVLRIVDHCATVPAFDRARPDAQPDAQ
jgi:maleylacetoacetate isomerase